MAMQSKANQDWEGFFQEAKFAFLFDHLLFTKDVNR